MWPFLKLSLDILPQTSLFRSGEPLYLIFVPFLAAIPEAMVMLHLAWQSIGLRIPVRSSIGTSIIAGLSACLIRQLLPLPFHIVINLVILTVCIMVKGHIGIKYALLGGIFAVSITIVSSSLTIEPLLVLHKTFLKSSLGFTLGSLIEIAIPLLILVLFTKFNLTLLPRRRNAVDRHEKTL